jgi:zinc D-Ala-D-Ala dipeptidase
VAGALALVALANAVGPRPAKAGEGHLVALADVAPTIRQDVRYATRRNFTGQPLPGYKAAKCLLRPEAANGLARAQAELAKAKPALGLKVFDCYRPMRAVRAMVRWTEAAAGISEEPFYFPGHQRERLVALGYISSHSSHARGIAVDLTLVTMAIGGKVAAPSADAAKSMPNGTCRDRGGDPADPSELDMGTTFDCFDPRSATRAKAITALARKNRLRLVDAMGRHGFRNYAREWWHYTYVGRSPDDVLDIVIK